SIGTYPDSIGTYPALATNAEGRVFAASGQVVKEWIDGEWITIGVPVDTGGGFHPQWMTVNSTHIAVAYVDGENKNRIRVKMQPLE
ncbi:MAG: hypothetical protein JXJ04_07160, partial [Spirochaetales bacterium]|nr:hypothetical protein [Spirochaetales bacterium]